MMDGLWRVGRTMIVVYLQGSYDVQKIDVRVGENWTQKRDDQYQM